MLKSGLWQKMLLAAFGIFVSLIILEVIARVFIDISPNFYEFDPILGYKLIPNAVGKSYGQTIKINSQGLRDTEHDYRRKYPLLRIAILGDSFTMGVGIEDIQDIYPKIIEKELPGVEVINLGVGGYNTDQEINFFKTEGIKYHPDLVILMFFINDNQAMLADIPGMQKLEKYHILQIRELLRKNIYMLKYAKELTSLAIQTYFKPEAPEKIPSVLAYKECLGQITNFSPYLKAKNSKLIVFLLPEIENFKNYRYTQVHDYIRTNLAKNGIICYDLLPDFKALELDSEDLWVSRQNHHLNKLGQRYLAQFVLRRLKPVKFVILSD
ncbi:MAG: SGNH/GDSL hydrolase family protein [Candidatus Omnitrophota bacterium]|jgi:hypothetical protein